MNAPLARGTAIDTRRYQRWLSRFSGYQNPVTRNSIEDWLGQFSQADRDIAGRILDSVLFIGYQAIQNSYRGLLNGIGGWNIRANARQGQWFFVPFSSSAGESGDSMLHHFRMANGLSHKRFNPLFIYRSELFSKKLGPDDTVVLIDDLSASGKQACDSWNEFFGELITGSPRIALFLVAATDDAVDKIRDETEMEPHCHKLLTNKDNFFHASCTHFSNNEKTAAMRYCQIADRQRPKGFGDRGLLLVFAHRSPNNSIPILHNDNNRWSSLFPRH